MTLLKKCLKAGELRPLFPKTCTGSCGDEREIWDSIAQEPAKLSGTKVRLFSLRRAANRHPLYKEPSEEGKEWEFQGPWEVYAALEFMLADSITPEATDAGVRRVSEAIAWISRKELEDHGAPHPKMGDVLEFWWEGAFGEPKSQAQWNIIKAEPDGSVWTSATFVQWKLELRRRDRFVAARETEHTEI